MLSRGHPAGARSIEDEIRQQSRQRDLSPAGGWILTAVVAIFFAGALVMFYIDNVARRRGLVPPPVVRQPGNRAVIAGPSCHLIAIPTAAGSPLMVCPGHPDRVRCSRRLVGPARAHPLRALPLCDRRQRRSGPAPAESDEDSYASLTLRVSPRASPASSMDRDCARSRPASTAATRPLLRRDRRDRWHQPVRWPRPAVARLSAAS